MTVSAGTKLGPYEILAPLGAGGMGEVYRARDERLKRDVAIKVLPAELSADAERRTRFEREARSASGLSHPNILTVYDIGSSNGTVYIAMELVEGGTLKDLTASGPVPTRKLLELATQVADGLAAAHAAGIVHRDLKPANVMVSKHGFAKILDFGLAKLVTPEDQEVSGLKTAAGDATRPGMVMGTAGYMSPEQAAGRTVDFRSDQFSFGSILYEMATGKRAFERSTTAETLTAIIREEPEPVSQLNARIPAPVRWIVERCLSKDPEDRFGTTKDLARDLADVRDHLSEASVSGPQTGEQPAVAVRAKRRLPVWVLLLATLAAAAAGIFGGRRLWQVEPPTFKQLTFRRGTIASARFAPDAQTVFYSAGWEGRPMEVYISRPESPESRPFGLAGAEVLAVSTTGELALSLSRRAIDPFIRGGTLARLSMAGGGSPREVLNDVMWADWSPDGKQLAIVREIGGAQQLEYPIGKVLVRTAGWLESLRVSPKGDQVAFLDHPARSDDGGTVDVVDGSGKKKVLSKPFASGHGLAWSPKGDEVWYTAARVGGNRALYSANMSGGERPLYRITGNLTLQDVARDGRVLITQDVERLGNLGRGPGQDKEVELTWLDWSLANDLSPDGRVLLFTESGEGGGIGYSAYTRNTDGTPAVRLGEGSANSLSPDGKSAAGMLGISSSEPHIFVYPIGPGDPKTLSAEGIDVQNVTWMPDGKGLVMTASEPGHGPRLYRRSLDGKPRAISPEGYRMFSRAVSPDGQRVIVRGPDQRWYLYPLEGGEPSAVPGLESADQPSGWTADGKAVFVFRRAELPARVSRLDIASGKRELWKELLPADASGVTEVTSPLPTPDGKYYVYTYIRRLSDLYVAEGLK
jgi:Tol biopolymer transport system component